MASQPTKSERNYRNKLLSYNRPYQCLHHVKELVARMEEVVVECVSQSKPFPSDLTEDVMLALDDLDESADQFSETLENGSRK
jgi:hypothetical protein